MKAGAVGYKGVRVFSGMRIYDLGYCCPCDTDWLKRVVVSVFGSRGVLERDQGYRPISDRGYKPSLSLPHPPPFPPSPSLALPPHLWPWTSLTLPPPHFLQPCGLCMGGSLCCQFLALPHPHPPLRTFRSCSFPFPKPYA